MFAAVLFENPKQPGQYLLISPYDKSFVDRLRDFPRVANWDASLKAYVFDDGGIRTMRTAASEYYRLFDMTLVKPRFVPPPPPPPPRNDSFGDYAILKVSNDADLDIITGAYRVLANRYHPDKTGGDAERMKIINGAYDRLKKRLGGARV